jgi:hypothetical protein
MTAHDAGELTALRAAAYALLRRDPDHRDAHLRLYEIEQMLGTPAAAVAHLRAALRTSPLVAPAAGADGRIRVLALTRIARWEANVPLELVVDESRFALTRLYLDGTEHLDALLAQVPPHDIVFNTIAESDEAAPALDLAARLVDALAAPCINDPRVVAGLSRDRVARQFAASSTVIAPLVERATAAQLAAREIGEPVLVRPVGSQAGVGLERIATTAELRAYAERTPAPAYFLTPFVDYRSDDGFFRKYRIMFVAGAPYACHLAISPRWMIHYYNAPMSEHAWMREEEAAFVADVAAAFHGRLGDALREIAAAVPIAYFGIDCAIARDGRLLLFEADAAMLVHGTDPPGLYPYKHAAWDRIKTALSAVLAGDQGSVSGR